MRVHVLYTTRGQVQALFQPAADAEGPQVEFRPGRGQRTALLDVPAELQGKPLPEIHRSVVVRLLKAGPRLACRRR